MPMWIYDLETLEFRAVNNAAIAHYGYSEAEFLALTIVDLRPPEEAIRLRQNLKNSAHITLQKSGLWVHRRKDGAVIDVEITSHAIEFDGRACRFVLAHDVTERVQADLKIARLNRVYAVLSGINSAIVRIRDRDALFKEACRLATVEGGFLSAAIAVPQAGSAELTVVADSGRGLPPVPPDLVELCPAERVMRERRQVICNNVAADPAFALLAERMHARDVRSLAAFPLAVGERIEAVLTLYANIEGVFDADEMKVLNELAGDLAFALLFFEREEHISYLAYYDVMTALPNRRLFLDRLAQLVHLDGAHHALVVALINLDRFAQLNDALGRHAGDALLVQIAARLGERLPEAFTLSRIGGDTFGLTFVELERGEDAAGVLRERVFRALDEPFRLDGQTVRISSRAGLALWPADGADADTLFKHAEAALKNARSTGERYLFYAPRMNAALAARLALENELQAALEAHQFELHYQPRVNLDTGAIVSAEALIRWNHPEQGLVGPVSFIPLAEETGLIRPIGAWVIDAVCAQQAAWRTNGAPMVPVSINLSAVQSAQPDLLPTIRSAIATHRVEEKYLEFELTETAVMNNPDEAARNLAELKQLGVHLSLDDFGTGYSSLAQLKRFPFDFVKIDRSFIAGVDTNPEDAVIAAAIIAMAHSLHLRVVAEGVETRGQLDVLRSLHCDEIQGYYFSRPVMPDVFEEMLKNGAALPPPESGVHYHI
ncbi:EAL domain-containing protein [Massilia sp. RP-1-19]|uniref:EAL domain-containing protein n=2 Tax=Massilia polaris TaxID=2728846 RepID=A0A848HQU3_9BURK|nr:EAL domain-containing protein [Massilia polaris]